MSMEIPDAFAMAIQSSRNSLPMLISSMAIYNLPKVLPLRTIAADPHAGQRKQVDGSSMVKVMVPPL